MKKKIFLMLRVIISLSAVFLLVWMMRSSITGVMGTIKTTNLPLLLFCIMLNIIIIVVISWRLKLVLSTQQTSISLREVTSVSFIGLFFNNFMPTSMGGDVMKAYYVYKTTAHKMKAFTAVFVDRLIGLVTIIFISAIVLILWGRGISNQLVVNAILVMVISSTVFIVFLANKPLAKKTSFVLAPLKRFGLDEKMKHIYRAVNNYGQYRRQIMCAILVSLFAQIILMVIIYFLAKALNAAIPFSTVAVVVPLSATVSLVPSINGLGVREGTVVYFLQSIIGRDKAFALSLLVLGLLIMNSLIGGLVFLMKEHFKIKEIRQDVTAGQKEAIPIEDITENGV